MRETSLTPAELQRYERQLMIPEIGEEGQRKLAAARVLIIGAGGLGSPAAMYLAAAGLGVIGIADGDRAELSNLQRQVIHGESDLGREKPCSAAEFIKGLNSNVKVNVITEFLDEAGLEKIIGDYDLVLDCVDNFKSKLMINDVCVKAGKPFCHAGVRNFRGQVMTWLPGFPDLRELIGDSIADSEKGVMGMTAGVCGSIQAMEAVKYITGAGRLLTGRVFVFDGLEMRVKVIGNK
ncbi:MAG: HesA/MoeB/ThiF family protein [Ruminococcus sp.]|nr:HesA/MoeB/ThiF family protein [Ruminococcus sp.]